MTARKPTLATLLDRYSDACIHLDYVQQECDDYNLPDEDLVHAKQKEKNARNAIVRLFAELSK